MNFRSALHAWVVLLIPGAALAQDFEKDIQPLLKKRCVECHGPNMAKARLDLSTAAGVARGGKSGALLTPKKPAESLLWQRVEADEMPPKHPLLASEKTILKNWIAAGAPGITLLAQKIPPVHWAFAKLSPASKDSPRTPATIDAHLEALLKEKGLTLGPEADRATLIRRVAFTLTGLPPTPEEINAFLLDSAAGAYERMIERYLASPHYGEHWGRHWLDAVGYADANGYFGKESDRPHAWRYRDYVVRSFNADKPFNRFLREQLAGDELAGFVPGGPATPEQIELLIATHLLRNGPDGTDDSAASPDAKRIDRYAALEAAEQVVYTSLLGLTIKCARCHDHKLEPISQREYYQAQAIFYPAFNPDNWITPAQRVVKAVVAGDKAAWLAKEKDLEARLTKLRRDFRTWVDQSRPRGRELFADDFDKAGSWAASPAGSPPARTEKGRLLVAAGIDSWLATSQKIDWAPAEVGAAVQVTFDLLDDRTAPADAPCQYFGYALSANQFAGSAPGQGGNLFFDGRFDGGARLYRLQQGAKRYEPIGAVGVTPYKAGRNYGLRVTNVGGDKFRLEHLVNFKAEGAAFELARKDLLPGPFAFYRYPGRNYAVGNLIIEHFPSQKNPPKVSGHADAYGARLAEFTAQIQALEKLRTPDPGAEIAWLSDVSPAPPRVHLLKRGIYGNLGEVVQPAGLNILADPDNPFTVVPPGHKRTTGVRLALANWLLKSDSRANALVARVRANWLWQHHFGAGFVATPENFGLSGARPTHPALLEHLSAELVRTDWSVKAMHRLVLHSRAFRQSSAPSKQGLAVDPGNRLQWRFPLRRLQAESVRDAMLAASGELNLTIGGPPVLLDGVDGHGARGEVAVRENGAGGLRRSLYVQRRRNVLPTFLQLFDFPSIAATCAERTSSTVVLQSLAQLNSATARRRATVLADRLLRESADDAGRLHRAFVLCAGRPPAAEELNDSLEFLRAQRKVYAAAGDVEHKALSDFCQMLFASNLFLYVE